MIRNIHYQLGLLHLIYLLVNVDDEISYQEVAFLTQVRTNAHIDIELFEGFVRSLIGKSERQIYQTGIQLMNLCSDEERMRAFIQLFQMAEADGFLHAREVRLILYATRMSHTDIGEVLRRVELV